MNCLKHIREVARIEPKMETRYMLQGAASLLSEALSALCTDHSLENMQNLNGVWAHCTRVLTLATPQVPTPPNAGAARPEAMRKAA